MDLFPCTVRNIESLHFFLLSARLHGISDVSDDAVAYLSHAMEVRGVA